MTGASGPTARRRKAPGLPDEGGVRIRLCEAGAGRVQPAQEHPLVAAGADEREQRQACVHGRRLPRSLAPQGHAPYVGRRGPALSQGARDLRRGGDVRSGSIKRCAAAVRTCDGGAMFGWTGWTRAEVAGSAPSAGMPGAESQPCLPLPNRISMTGAVLAESSAYGPVRV
jgi:hypothetical protein